MKLVTSLVIGMLACAAVTPALADDHLEAAVDAGAAPYVRADVQAYLDASAQRPKMLFTSELLAKLRNNPAASSLSSLDLPVGELGAVRDVEMPGPGGKIALRLFDNRAERKPGPVVVFYHGGGFVVGSIATHSGLAAEMSRQLDLPVVSVEYRLAPEAPWPAAPDDAEAAARWVAENGAAFGREFTGLVISGDSAGGNLTLVTTLALREKPAALPVIMQLPIYPTSDMTRTYPSGEDFSDGYGLDSDNMALYRKHYAADVNDWRNSPLLADLTGLPPTVLVTASLDPLRDQGRAYAAKLVQSGVPTSYYEGEGLIHGFATFRKAIPSAQADTTAFLSLARAMLDTIEASAEN
ncbi:MAG: alpha/beta hydrolase [Novosphingobium sp.]|nr:alpha/beta hydrolase [Novosphingobium sp.]